MKVFISWSGERSKAVATAFKEWLPDVLQETTAWMSEHDIDAGARWSQRLSQVLEESKLGIVCLTPESQKSAWVLFEAGALSKSVEESRLIPFLIGMTASDVEPPLSQFQAVQADRVGTLKLLESINAACSVPLPGERVRRLFDRLWPDLEALIQQAMARNESKAKTPVRPERDMLSEVLQIVRSISKHKSRKDDVDEEVHHLEIDTRVFLGDKGRITRLCFLPDRTVSRFLDDIYFLMNRQGHVPAYTYGQCWLLKNSRTDELYDNVGIEYCLSHGQHQDNTAIYTLGIEDGDRLVVVPARP